MRAGAIRGSGHCIFFIFIHTGVHFVPKCHSSFFVFNQLAFTLFLQSFPCCLYGNNRSVFTFKASRCSVSLGCCNEGPRLGGLDLRCYFSELWRLVFPEASPRLVDGRLLPVSSHGRPSVCAASPSPLIGTPVMLDCCCYCLVTKLCPTVLCPCVL